MGDWLHPFRAGVPIVSPLRSSRCRRPVRACGRHGFRWLPTAGEGLMAVCVLGRERSAPATLGGAESYELGRDTSRRE